MAGEGGSRAYWPTYARVNLSNGNLHFSFGQTSCVTCGGGSANTYPSPMASRLSGPVLIFNSLLPGTRSDTYLWTYDGNGNRLTEHVDGARTQYACGSNNEMTEAGVQDFTYDHFGNTASIVSQQTFTYNFDNCMTQVDYASVETIDQHQYDGNMRRMRSKVNSAANWTNFIHDELTENLICEYTLVSGTYSIKALNTYGLGLISSNREGTIRYFHFDALGSTAHLTDTSQNVTDSYTYNAFGVPYTPSASSVNPYRYVGQWGYYDDSAMGSGSGMLLLGVRYYWPKYGHFTTWDPAHAALSTYVYLSGPPTMSIDPTGMEDEWNRIPAHNLPYRGLSYGRLLDPIGYGSYCGSDVRKNPGFAVLPQDCVDACCQTHDRCLEAHYGSSFSDAEAHYCCDGNLKRCVNLIWLLQCCPRSANPDQCRLAGRLIREGMWITSLAYTNVGRLLHKLTCVDKMYWPAAVRSNWGNPRCLQPSGWGSGH